MPKIEKFEDIEAWKLSRILVKNIYEVSKGDRIYRDFSFRDQLRRSAISIMANIAEGFERYSNKEFAQFLNIARASAGELRSHLYVALDLGYIDVENFNDLKKECLVISKCIYNFIKYLKQ